MTAGQPLRGFSGQSMSGHKKAPFSYAANFPPGSYPWTAPRAGHYLFVLWGAGDGNNTTPGGSGAYCEKTAYVARGASVAITVGAPLASGPGASTSITLPDGSVVTAGGGGISAAGNGGTATGGDVNLRGSDAGASGQGTGGGAVGSTTGAGAPANLPFRGGAGASAASNNNGGSPGGGCGGVNLNAGGQGSVLIQFAKP